MRRRPSYNPRGIGCKGGTSRTAGLRASVYEWTAPADIPVTHTNWRGEHQRDVCPAGTVLRTRSFKITAETAPAYPWCHDGKWHLGLCDGSSARDGEPVTARRIK